ncbi:acetyl-CoA acetyltransferase [Alphaproteobacteria bacterium]|nr:acetyl-CoA acetyltransferase [Alphaproteobacteria bacterium]
MIHDNTPILVGSGLIVQKEKDLSKAKSPVELLADAARVALDDCGQTGGVGEAVDTIASIRFVTDSPEARSLPYGQYANPARTVANIMGLSPAHSMLAATGGNSPQMMINELAERISQGRTDVALLVGGEGFASVMRAVATGVDKSEWNDAPDEAPEVIGQEKMGVLPVEHRHGLFFPVNYYPIFETALRAHLGRDVASHMQQVGNLMAPFTQVAAQHPQSWFPVARSAEELVTPSDENRWIGYPYPKYLNSVIRIDQASAVVMTSVGKARELGIDESKWVYLHGCSDATEVWYGLERQDLHRSVAIHEMTKQAMEMAGWSVDDIDIFDLYSCFPSAVEVACQEMGIRQDDPRPFTVTGGLPYFGGAGNAYTLMSVATMMQKLRGNPGAKGLCNGNGWFLTKHSLGLYSTTPLEGEWKRQDPAILQAQIDAGPTRTYDEKPSGEGWIESYTVAHVVGKPPLGILIGRMQGSDHRFVAHMTSQGDHVAKLMQEDGVGMKGMLATDENEINIFTPLS